MQQNGQSLVSTPASCADKSPVTDLPLPPYYYYYYSFTKHPGVSRVVWEKSKEERPSASRNRTRCLFCGHKRSSHCGAQDRPFRALLLSSGRKKEKIKRKTCRRNCKSPARLPALLRRKSFAHSPRTPRTPPRPTSRSSLCFVVFFFFFSASFLFSSQGFTAAEGVFTKKNQKNVASKKIQKKKKMSSHLQSPPLGLRQDSIRSPPRPCCFIVPSRLQSAHKKE